MVSSRRCTGQRSNKTVRFSDDDEDEKQIIEPAAAAAAEDTEAADDLTNNQELWYTQEDLKEIRRIQEEEDNCGIQLEESSSSSSSPLSSCSVLRDLSNSNGGGAVVGMLQDKLRQRRNYHEFVTGLLRQQEEQRQMGISDPKGLFQYSRACSKVSRQRARRHGQDQAKEVKTFCDEEEKRGHQDIIDVIDEALELLGI